MIVSDIPVHAETLTGTYIRVDSEYGDGLYGGMDDASGELIGIDDISEDFTDIGGISGRIPAPEDGNMTVDERASENDPINDPAGDFGDDAAGDYSEDSADDPLNDPMDDAADNLFDVYADEFAGDFADDSADDTPDEAAGDLTDDIVDYSEDDADDPAAAGSEYTGSEYDEYSDEIVEDPITEEIEEETTEETDSDVSPDDETASSVDPLEAGIDDLPPEIKDPIIEQVTASNEIWILGVKSYYEYTGTAIKPEIYVYYGTRPLTAGRDFTVSYSNNKKISAELVKVKKAGPDNNIVIKNSVVHRAKAKTPTIKVKLKGNYSGSRTLKFEIVPAYTFTTPDLTKATADPVYVKYKPDSNNLITPTVRNGKVKINIYGPDYAILRFPGAPETIETISNKADLKALQCDDCTDPGVYTVRVVRLKTIDSGESGGDSDPDGTPEPDGNPDPEGEPAPDGDTIPEVDPDPYNSDNYIDTPMYVMGSKDVQMSKASVSVRKADCVFTGDPLTPPLTVKYKGKKLTARPADATEDFTEYNYDVRFENNIAIGKATVILTGSGYKHNGYLFRGIKKFTFKITGKYKVNAHNVFFRTLNEANEEVLIPVTNTVENTYPLVYATKGAKPQVVITADTDYSDGTAKPRTLVSGRDYKISYKYNTKANLDADGNLREGVSRPRVIITMKGNYKADSAETETGLTTSKKITGYFDIGPSDIDDLVPAAQDVVYSSKSNAYKKTSITFYSVSANGVYSKRKLKSGTRKDYRITDYQIGSAEDADHDGHFAPGEFTADPDKTASGIAQTGDAVLVTYEGVNNYKGTDSAVYHIVSTSAKKKSLPVSIPVSKLTVTVNTGKSCRYTGSPIMPGQEDHPELKVVYKKSKKNIIPLALNTDYEIIGYMSNVNKGNKAAVIIRGIGAYTGIRTIRFRISARAESDGQLADYGGEIIEFPVLGTEDCLCVTAEEWGAVPGDGKDDTDEINKAIIAANDNYPVETTNVLIPAGEYNITASDWGGITMKSHVSLYLDPGAVLKVKPTSNPGYAVIYVGDIEDVHIEGGTIAGERSSHKGSTGEWGHGIKILGSKNVEIVNMTIMNNWGDGIYTGIQEDKTGDITTSYKDCSDITISGCSIINNRRDNISICSGKGVTIDHCNIYKASGTNPEAGINIEPVSIRTKSGTKRIQVKDVTISNCDITCKTKNQGTCFGILTLEGIRESKGIVGDGLKIVNCTIDGDVGNYSMTNASMENTTIKGTFFYRDKQTAMGARVESLVTRIKNCNIHQMAYIGWTF